MHMAICAGLPNCMRVGCDSDERAEDALPMKECSGCRVVRYCSREVSAFVHHSSFCVFVAKKKA
jgi:dTDP-4-dehydrorhamnose reductase